MADKTKITPRTENFARWYQDVIAQAELAERLGVSFQQVQKYERGANRVRASKLYEIAKSLQTSIAYFFEGLVDPSTARAEGVADSGAEPFLHDFLMTPAMKAHMRQVQLRAAYRSGTGADVLLWVTSLLDDAAQAMTYNEYAQVLEQKNPKTGALYQPSDLSVINWNDVGTAMLTASICCRSRTATSS